MKRIFTILLVCVLVFAFAACTTSGQGAAGQDSQQPQPSSQPASSQESAPALTAEQIAQMIDEKLPPAREITNIFNGTGLEHEEPADPAGQTDENGQCFVPVTEEAYQSVQDITQATEAVFTKACAQQYFYQYALQGQYARYKDVDGKLYIDINQGGTNNGFNWLTGTLSIVEQDENKIIVKCEYVSNYGDKGEGELTLEKEDGEWKFASMV